MPSKRISELSDAGASQPTDLIPIVRSGVNMYVLVSQVKPTTVGDKLAKWTFCK